MTLGRAFDDVRHNGILEKDGKIYRRQAPIQKMLKGKTIDIAFAFNRIVKGFYGIIEAEYLQPSHRSGVQNHLHFIPEAQPRNRSTSQSGRETPQLIARQLRPAEIIEGATAYVGAPVANLRGEIIQGNGRGDVLLIYYSLEPNGETYKNYFTEGCNANFLGFSAKTIKSELAKFKKPVLVRFVDVSDEEAIQLGQFQAKDLEAVSNDATDSKARVNRIAETDLAKMVEALLRYDKGDATLSEIIRDSNALSYFVRADVLRKDELEKYTKNGAANAKGIEFVRNFLLQFIFAQAKDTNIGDLFEKMPHHTQKGIEKALLYVLKVHCYANCDKSNHSITQEVANAVGAAQELMASGMTFKDWKRQKAVFNPSPQERFSALELELAKIFAEGKTQKEIADKFKRYAYFATDKPATLVEPAQKALPKKEAISNAFGLNGLGCTPTCGCQKNKILNGCECDSDVATPTGKEEILTVKLPVSIQTLQTYLWGKEVRNPSYLSKLSERDFVTIWKYTLAANTMLAKSILPKTDKSNRHILHQVGSHELVKLVNEEFTRRGLTQKYTLFTERKEQATQAKEVEKQPYEMTFEEFYKALKKEGCGSYFARHWEGVEDTGLRCFNDTLVVPNGAYSSMTDDWNSYMNSYLRDSYDEKNVESKKRFDKFYDALTYEEKVAMGRVSKDENGYPHTVGFHRKTIEKALSEGKTVSKEVLKDYPDLQQKATSEPKKEVVESKMFFDKTEFLGKGITPSLSVKAIRAQNAWFTQYMPSAGTLSKEQREKLKEAQSKGYVLKYYKIASYQQVYVLEKGKYILTKYGFDNIYKIGNKKEVEQTPFEDFKNSLTVKNVTKSTKHYYLPNQTACIITKQNFTPVNYSLCKFDFFGDKKPIWSYPKKFDTKVFTEKEALKLAYEFVVWLKTEKDNYEKQNPTSEPKKEVEKQETSIPKRLQTLEFTLSLSTSEAEKKELQKRIDTLKFTQSLGEISRTYKINDEGKAELFFEYQDYKNLAEEDKKEIKRNFLFSRPKAAWVSRGKFPNIPFRVIENLGFKLLEKEERKTFEEQLETKKEKAEYRSERFANKAHKLHKEAEKLQSRFKQLAKDWSWLTQPNIDTSQGRAFANARNKVYRDFDKGREQYAKSTYYKERSNVAASTAEFAKYTSPVYLQSKIKEVDRAIKKMSSWLPQYIEKTHEQSTESDLLKAQLYLDNYTELLEQKAFLVTKLTELEANGIILYNKENLKKALYVRIAGSYRKYWVKVAKLNPTTVSFLYLTQYGDVTRTLKEPYENVIDAVYEGDSFNVSPRTDNRHFNKWNFIIEKNTTEQTASVSISKRIKTLEFTLSLASAEAEKKELQKRIDTLKFTQSLEGTSKSYALKKRSQTLQFVANL